MPSRKSVAVSESAATLRSKVSAEKRGLATKSPSGSCRGKEKRKKLRERVVQRGTEKEGSKSSCTCVVAIIRMVGHSCNAGAHTMEWIEEGVLCARQVPTMHQLYYSLSLSLSPSLLSPLSLVLLLSRYMHLSRLLSHYASTALSRILEAGLARSQVGSRFSRSSYVPPLLCTRRESTYPRLLPPPLWRPLLCYADSS